MEHQYNYIETVVVLIVVIPIPSFFQYLPEVELHLLLLSFYD